MGQAAHRPAYAATTIAGAGSISASARATNAPIWLVGTSQGSIGAAYGAAHLPGKVAGVVLTSSVAGHSNSGETVFDSDLGAIAVPALVVVEPRPDTLPHRPASGFGAADPRGARPLAAQGDRLRRKP